MPRYAKETTVPAERTRAEIEQTLRRYEATEFHFGWRQNEEIIAFRINNLFVRFILPLPSPTDRKFTHKKDRSGCYVLQKDLQVRKAWEQGIRQRWRALLLTIKAKLEAVECGISTIEQEFLAFVVLPDDRTMVEWLSDSLEQIRKNQMPALEYKPPQMPEKDVADAEFEEKSHAP